MVASLQSRKEALEAKIQEKNEELKKLCLQEADLTGVIPPEIPLEPGEPPPPIRRRVGTSFSFPQNLINNVKDADDESLTALELECKVQTNIAEAALALANDTSANKAARRKHRLMYRQSQRRLMELETRLSLLKQGKAHQLKPQQIKKKPRPNTTAVENFVWNKGSDVLSNFSGSHLGSWPGKMKSDFMVDDIDGNRDYPHQNDVFNSLQRSFKSTETSQSSGSPRTDVESDEFKMSNNQMFNVNSFPNHWMVGMYPYPNVHEGESSKVNLSPNTMHHKRNGKRGVVRRQWDTQSAGGTLLPSQTYPDHSHQPNLSRTQSLGSVESAPQKPKDSWSMQDFMYESSAPKEKEWYETSLDSAPSPPLRTTSKLPTTARLLCQMQEMKTRDSGNWNTISNHNLQPSNSHPVLPTTPNLVHKTVVRSSSAFPATESTNIGIDNLSSYMGQMHLNPNTKGRNPYYSDSVSQKDFPFHDTESKGSFEYSGEIQKTDSRAYQTEAIPKLEIPVSNNSNENRFLFEDPNVGVPLTRQNSLTQSKYKNNTPSELSPKKIEENFKNNNSVYVNIPEDNVDAPLNNWLLEEDPIQRKGNQVAVPQEAVGKVQTPTQPYYHAPKHSPAVKIKNLQYQAAKNRHTSISEDQANFQPPSPVRTNTPVIYPPHAITQNEISFDTVVPFESPQNHTVVQAGKWQPYREVTKPFEMSDFYKYSTKFRQNKGQGTRSNTPDVSRQSPNTTHQKGVYTPLKPMTCRPVESRYNQPTPSTQMEPHCDEKETNLVEVSPPEIV